MMQYTCYLSHRPDHKLTLLIFILIIVNNILIYLIFWFTLKTHRIKQGGNRMQYKAPGRCAICQHDLHINRLKCSHCHSVLEGDFFTCKFCQLPNDQLDFLEIFVKCRGNIKDIEMELGISYPTVRNRLDNLIETLGYKVEKSERVDIPTPLDKNKQRQEILLSLENSEITPQEATRLLKKIVK